jgi:hypothetical protein
MSNRELINRLRRTNNWKREIQDSWDWKDVTLVYDRAPFEAAHVIDGLDARVEQLEKELAQAENILTKYKLAWQPCYNCSMDSKGNVIHAYGCPNAQVYNNETICTTKSTESQKTLRSELIELIGKYNS